MTEQQKQLKRVKEKIGDTVLEFCRGQKFFTTNTLHAYVSLDNNVAPASADRILRDLRKQGKVNYKVVNRSQSLYEVLSVA